MKIKNKNYDANNDNYGWIFLLILVFLFGCAIFGGYMLYQHATSPDNNLSFSEHTDLRDISDTNTASNLYNIITSNNVYYNMFYKEVLTNEDYLGYAFTRSNIDIPYLFGEKFTVLQTKISKTIENTFYLDNNNIKINYTDSSYNNYQYRCSYDNDKDLYDCYTNNGVNGTIPVLYSKIKKVEQESEYFYVYDQAAYVNISNDSASFYTDINYKNKINLCDNNEKTTTSCVGLIDNEKELSDYIFSHYENMINTYKHTFIKVNGSYYFETTELVSNEEAKK